MPVIIGADEYGGKDVPATMDGFRGNAGRWRDLLPNLKSRGPAPPELAFDDGDIGFRAALGMRIQPRVGNAAGSTRPPKQPVPCPRIFMTGPGPSLTTSGWPGQGWRPKRHSTSVGTVPS